MFKKDLEAAARTLGVALDGLTQSSLKLAYFERAKATHPDAGGSAEEFKGTTLAYKRLTEWLLAGEASKEGCNICGGAGYTVMRKGFRELRILCRCKKGRGDAAK